ncbi:hypothetical protein IQ07DRAFT_226334 [Pyrenochaeta sp. DS3sAY3a]|nr:hypothetical protein IQ07DRAFT_226334 [Pyrenochaeta sp. DS3sAY3a]
MSSLNNMTIAKLALYHTQTAPRSLHRDLVIQDTYLRAGDAPNVRTDPGLAVPVRHEEPFDALDIARVIATHLGFVPSSSASR